MMIIKKSILLIPFILLWGCHSENAVDIAEKDIRTIREKYAPDKRVAIFDIQWQNGTLTGETDLPQAYEELLGLVKEKGLEFNDSIRLLPDPQLGMQTKALVTISVANIRSQPRHSAELATQALMGTPLNVLKKQDNWYLIQTPDQYISWVDAAGIQLFTEEEIKKWANGPRIVCTAMISYVYQEPGFKTIVSDITAGNVLEMTEASEAYFKVVLPDGRTGYINRSDAMDYKAWTTTRSLADDDLIQTAKNMMGVPYLWGGTSPKGMDCSGFTKTVYFLNGMVIPRDASQQVHEGKEIDSQKNWDQLEVGDLLFFGSPATDSTPERVIHVGMWIGNHSLIHARGRVRISSFDPGSENFDEYELNRYLRTKRIRNVSSENILAVESLTQ